MAVSPQISVVMSVFNGERYISEAIRSILNQSFEDFEFIIIDDKSTDDTPAIISQFKDRRIVFVQNKENIRQTKALNIGIQKSRAPYIARMDADDVAAPERLEEQWNFLETHPEIAVVGSWCLDIDENGKSLRLYKVPTDPFWVKCCLSGSGDLTAWCITHPSIVIRKKALLDVGGYNEDRSFSGYPQDYDLWMRLAQSHEFANIAKPLLKYRVLSHSQSRAFLKDSLQYRNMITEEKIKRYMPDLADNELKSLTEMLEYQPQSFYKEGCRVLERFDRYFDCFLNNGYPLHLIEKAKNRIKFYYLPILFLTHKGLCVKEFIRIAFHYPSCMIDAKFYRKLIRVFIRTICSESQYHFLTNKILSWR